MSDGPEEFLFAVEDDLDTVGDLGAEALDSLRADDLEAWLLEDADDAPWSSLDHDDDVVAVELDDPESAPEADLGTTATPADGPPTISLPDEPDLFGVDLDVDLDDGGEPGLLASEPAGALVAALTGSDLDGDELLRLATDLGLDVDDADGGLACHALAGVLDHLGVDAHVTYGDVDVLRDHLANGSTVLIGEGRLVSMDPAASVAVVERPDGTAGSVPLGDLLRAWDDVANEMLVAPGSDTIVLPIAG